MSDINWDLIPQWAYGIALSKGEVYLIGSREKPCNPDDVVLLAIRPIESCAKRQSSKKELT